MTANRTDFEVMKPQAQSRGSQKGRLNTATLLCDITFLIVTVDYLGRWLIHDKFI